MSSFVKNLGASFFQWTAESSMLKKARRNIISIKFNINIVDNNILLMQKG